jgi:ABC-type glutathione transport system ATPase component
MPRLKKNSASFHLHHRAFLLSVFYKLKVKYSKEKNSFASRQNYINQIIKDKLKVPASKVSIVGPGGSGKSQVAFKAINKYTKEDIFNLVIPIYFEGVLLS